MNIIQQHLKIDKRWGSLPAATSVASFNFFDQSIVFSAYTEKHVQNIHQEKTPVRILEKVGGLYVTAYHEYRHWLDLTSSTYGLTWLSQLLTVGELVTSKAETNSVRRTCMAVSQLAAEIHLPKYYSVLEGLHDDRPWHYETTVGRAYNTTGAISENHPIWFVRFQDARGRPIARQPISIASLLETRAVEAELSATALILLQTKTLTEVEKGYVQDRFIQDAIKRVYSPELTLYSAAAHWYAINRKNSDIAEAYLSASRLANFCLNAPSEWIASLQPTRQFEDGMGSDTSNLMRKSLLRQDRAALFFMMAYDKRIISYENFDVQLDEVLREWGTDASTLKNAASSEKVRLLEQLRLQAPKSLGLFLDAINFNQKATQEYDEVQQFIRLKLPAILLHGDIPFNIFTFKTRAAAFSGNVFNPKAHAMVFGNIEKTVHANRQYTEHAPHCFAKD